ncbi:hypothetical protein ACFQE2_03065 [Methylophaga thalassica]|uniref:hypothetical protein n=1 Tax=Methylophaga thalassica TaxID=40223 RepID=UPI00360AD28F
MQYSLLSRLSVSRLGTGKSHAGMGLLSHGEKSPRKVKPSFNMQRLINNSLPLYSSGVNVFIKA